MPCVDKQREFLSSKGWSKGRTKPQAMRDILLTLPNSSFATLRIPKIMSEEDFDSLLNSLQMWKKTLVSPSIDVALSNQIILEPNVTSEEKPVRCISLHMN